MFEKCKRFHLKWQNAQEYKDFLKKTLMIAPGNPTVLVNKCLSKNWNVKTISIFR